VRYMYRDTFLYRYPFTYLHVGFWSAVGSRLLVLIMSQRKSDSSYTHTQTYTLTHTFSHTFICIHIHTLLHMHLHIHLHMHIRTHALTHTHTHTHAGLFGNAANQVGFWSASCHRGRVTLLNNGSGRYFYLGCYVSR